MIAMAQSWEKGGWQNTIQVVTEFGPVTSFEVPVNYHDDDGFHFFANEPKDAVEMFVFGDVPAY